MKTRLYNARIMSMVNGCDIEMGEIWVENLPQGGTRFVFTLDKEEGHDQ